MQWMTVVAVVVAVFVAYSLSLDCMAREAAMMMLAMMDTVCSHHGTVVVVEVVVVVDSDE